MKNLSAIRCAFTLCVLLCSTHVSLAQIDEEELATETGRNAMINQIGLENTASILQHNVQPELTGSVRINQRMLGNSAKVYDLGHQNTVLLQQEGYENNAELWLYGDGNRDLITQYGVGNLFEYSSHVDSQLQFCTQSGRDNILIIDKYPDSGVPVEIHQVGIGIRTIIK